MKGGTEMPVRTATVTWEGNLKNGKGQIKSESGALDGSYSAGSRFDNDKGTNPEELMGSALASCYSMALSGMLERAGFIPQRVDTEAKVHLEPANGGGFKITSITLETKARVPTIDEPTFKKHAEEAKKNCPVSKVMTGAEITLEASIVS